jgi:hypothetical protein
MQRRKKTEENEREKLFHVKRKKCLQKELARADIVRDVRYSERHDQGVAAVGRWHAVALFHDGDKVTENDGTYDIKWTLEETYRERPHCNRTEGPEQNRLQPLQPLQPPNNRAHGCTDYAHARIGFLRGALILKLVRRFRNPYVPALL